MFSEAHATRMISHLVQQLNKNDKPCRGKIDEVLMEQYTELCTSKNSVFEPMKGVAVVEFKDELAEVFGESYMERNDEFPGYIYL